MRTGRFCLFVSFRSHGRGVEGAALDERMINENEAADGRRVSMVFILCCMK